MYVSAQVIHDHFQQNKNRPLNFAGADEMELEMALKESMKTFEAEDRAAAGGGGAGDGGMVGSVLNRGGPGAAPEEEKKF